MVYCLKTGMELRIVDVGFEEYIRLVVFSKQCVLLQPCVEEGRKSYIEKGFRI